VQHGLLVEQVQAGSPAARAGLKAGNTDVTVAGETYNLGGDLIVRADGAGISSLARLRTLVAAKEPGESMKLQVYRGSKKLDLIVTLGRQPAAPPG
jgi:S1-C subfamily serine protease